MDAQDIEEDKLDTDSSRKAQRDTCDSESVGTQPCTKRTNEEQERKAKDNNNNRLSCTAVFPCVVYCSSTPPTIFNIRSYGGVDGRVRPLGVCEQERVSHAALQHEHPARQTTRHFRHNVARMQSYKLHMRE